MTYNSTSFRIIWKIHKNSYPIRPVFQRFLRKGGFIVHICSRMQSFFWYAPRWITMGHVALRWTTMFQDGSRWTTMDHDALRWTSTTMLYIRPCCSTLDLVQGVFGRGVASFWPRCDFMPWTRSTDCASEVSVVHGAWTRSNHCFSTSSRN